MTTLFQMLKVLHVSVKVGDSEVVLCCIYKPPNVSLDLDIAITSYIDNMCNSFTNSRSFIFGDFNYPNIICLGQIPTTNENVEITFLECLMANNLNQIIDFPTRANNMLDLVLCKDGFNSANASVISIINIISKTFNNGILPDIWKKAIVIPIYKGKGTQFDVNNYRPINLTCVLCKVMASIIRN